MAFNTHTLLDRFLRYVRIDTQADDRTTAYPSSPGQLVLGKMLRDELLAMGIKDAVQDEHGLVFGTVPGNVPGAPTIAFNAHVDTNPENSGKNVDPQVIRNYPGGDIVLPKDTSKVIRVSDNPELNDLVGKTIITTDGTTLLGADDKAGLSVIMEAARILIENPPIPHGPVRVVFTCDEEIGRGVLHLEPSQVGAVVAYTLDGAGPGEIEDETFSADAATVTVTGVNIHPMIAKGRMINAIRLAGDVPRPAAEADDEPRDDRRPGGVPPPADHRGRRRRDEDRLPASRLRHARSWPVQAELLREIARQVEREYPGAKVKVETRKQYRNMRDGIAKMPQAVAFAEEAIRRAGLEPKRKIIRGGTDGAQLTEKGLPTPNLSTGEHNPHSPLEWTCLEEMEAAVRVVIELCQVWAGK